MERKRRPMDKNRIQGDADQGEQAIIGASTTGTDEIDAFSFGALFRF